MLFRIALLIFIFSLGCDDLQVNSDYELDPDEWSKQLGAEPKFELILIQPLDWNCSWVLLFEVPRFVDISFYFVSN